MALSEDHIVTIDFQASRNVGRGRLHENDFWVTLFKAEIVEDICVWKQVRSWCPRPKGPTREQLKEAIAFAHSQGYRFLLGVEEDRPCSAYPLPSSRFDRELDEPEPAEFVQFWVNKGDKVLTVQRVLEGHRVNFLYTFACVLYEAVENSKGKLIWAKYSESHHDQFYDRASKGYLLDAKKIAKQTRIPFRAKVKAGTPCNPTKRLQVVTRYDRL